MADSELRFANLGKIMKKNPEERTEAEEEFINKWQPTLDRVKPDFMLFQNSEQIQDATNKVYLNQAREEADRATREQATLDRLDTLCTEIGEQGTDLARLATQAQEQEEKINRLRTGAPGRPTSMHVIKAEFKRRTELGQVEITLAEQARVLLDWLTQAHSDADVPTCKTVKNSLRVAYRRVKPKQTDSQ